MVLGVIPGDWQPILLVSPQTAAHLACYPDGNVTVKEPKNSRVSACRSCNEARSLLRSLRLVCSAVLGVAIPRGQVFSSSMHMRCGPSLQRRGAPGLLSQMQGVHRLLKTSCQGDSSSRTMWCILSTRSPHSQTLMPLTLAVSNHTEASPFEST